MEILLWQQTSSWLKILNFTEYSGPWPIKSSFIDQNRIIIAVGNRLLLVRMDPFSMIASRQFDSTIRHCQHRKGKIVIVSKTKLHLLNDLLESIKQIRLQSRQILSVSSDDNVFKILFCGEPIQNTQFVRFLKVDTVSDTELWSAYHGCLKLIISDSKMTVKNQENRIMKEYQLNLMLDGQLRLECCNNVPILIRNNEEALCLSTVNLRPLYAFKIKNLKIAGDCLVLEKQLQSRILRISERGLVDVGHMDKTGIEKLILTPNGQKMAILSLKNEKNCLSLVISEGKQRETRSIENSLTTLVQHQASVELSGVCQKIENSFVEQVIENMIPVTTQAADNLMQTTNSVLPAKCSDQMEPTAEQLPSTPVLTASSTPTPQQNFNSLHSFVSRHSLSNIQQVQQSLFSNNQSVMKQKSHKAENLFRQNTLPTAQELINQLNNNDFYENFMIKKLSLIRLQTLDYCTYQYLKGQSIRQLVTEFYKPRGKYSDAVEYFLKQLIESNPEQIIAFLKQNKQFIVMHVERMISQYRQIKLKILQLCRPLLSDMLVLDVPASLISLKQSYVEILLTICPQLLFGQLSNDMKLLQKLIDAYFSKDHTSMMVTLEEYKIDIGNPRNLLNVLLFFAQVFQEDISQTIKIYCKAAIRNGYLNMVSNIIFQEEVLDICEVPVRPFVEELLKEVEEEAYQHGRQFGEELVLIRWRCPWMRLTRRRLKVIKFLESEGVKFNKRQFYRIGQNLTVFGFLSAIIQQLDVVSLSSFNLEYIYDRMRVLEMPEPEKPCLALSFYTVELVILMEQLIVKLVYHHQLAEAYKKMQCIKSRLHSSVILFAICMCLRMDRDGAKEFAGLTNGLQSSDLLSVLRQLLRGQKKGILRRKRQKYFNNIFLEFKSKLAKQEFVSCLSQRNFQAMSLLIYGDPAASIELSRLSHVVNPELLQQFLQKLADSDQLSQAFRSDHNPSEPTNKICFDLPLTLQKKLSASSIGSADDTMIPTSLQSIKKHSRSSTSIIPSRVFDSQEVRNSSMVIESLENQKDILQSIYEEEGAIKLRDFYKTNKCGTRLQHLQQLCQLQQLKIGYDYRRIFPFKVLTSSGSIECIQQNIVEEMTIKKFWLISFMTKRVLGCKVQSRVAYLFLKKQIMEETNQKQLKQQFQAVLQSVQIQPQQIGLLNDLVARRGLKVPP